MKICCPECKHEFEVNPYGGAETPVRIARQGKGLTVIQAAEAIDISVHTLRELERGKMNPRLSTIRALCRLYEKSVDELFPAIVEETESVSDEK